MHIEFTEGEDKITLEGPTKDVQMVQSQIEAIVTDLVSLHVEKCLDSVPIIRVSPLKVLCSKVDCGEK